MERAEKERRPADWPTVKPTRNGPYLVKNLRDLRNSRGEPLESRPEMRLCRCGGSSTKPYCDGTHARIGFRGDKSDDRVADRVDDYEGGGIAIHDNRGVCAHSGHCTDNLPSVFRLGSEPWVDPLAANAEEIAETIRICPSGALSYSRDGVLYKHQDRKPAITVSKNGPYRVVGGPEFVDPEGSQPESEEHFTLCRCGGSANKPFCSGAHWHLQFKDDRN